MTKNKEPTEERQTESRRDMLRKIGVALAATTVAGSEARGQYREATKIARPIQGNIKLTSAIRTAVTEEEDLKIFFATTKRGAASVLVLKASDAEAVKAAQTQLRATPATARVVNGVVQVNLGIAAEGRCNLSGAAAAAAINFGDPPPIDVGPLVRQ